MCIHFSIFFFKFEYSSWRAMVIKDNSGDWGICTAAWKGLTPGVPGRPGKFLTVGFLISHIMSKKPTNLEYPLI